MRKIRSGGILVETMSECELKRIQECTKFGEIRLSVAMLCKIGPKVIVYDIPNEMTSEELLKAFYKKNAKGCVPENVFKERVRIVSRGGSKDAAWGNVILEVPSCVKYVVCNERRMFVCMLEGVPCEGVNECVEMP